jgi:membrane protein implicated in regulation of membrane protease activity
MTTVLLGLWRRFLSELPLWRLHSWQLAVLGLLAIWPWLVQALFPGHELLSLAPVFVFLPVGYFVGGLFMALLPVSWAYQLGVSVTVFVLSYLVIVSWRSRRAKAP